MRHKAVHKFIVISLCTAFFIALSSVNCFSQCFTSLQFYNNLTRVEKDNTLSPDNKLIHLSALQRLVDSCRLPRDSVYAHLLHRTGVLKYATGKPNEAISCTIASAQINTSGRKHANPRLAVNSYYNLGYYFKALIRYKEALSYFDSCTIAGSNYKDSLPQFFVINARLEKAYLYYQTGDYQKAVEETALGLRMAASINNPALRVNLLNEQAKAYAAIKQINAAILGVNRARLLIDKDDFTASANNYKIQATISEAAGKYGEAMDYHKKVIWMRSKNHDTAALSVDYLDAGNTIRNKSISNRTEDFSGALSYYNKSLQLAEKSGNSITAEKALNNLASISFRSKKYADALEKYHQCLQKIVIPSKNTTALSYPTHRQCNTISDKNVLSTLLANKAECLLYLYKQTGNTQHINAALKTALLTDSIITDMRHEQTGEQSKLYWRNETREFFTNAIEACYEAKNASLALYFMERSRAVLLNDKLNELGASAYLPAAEAAEEQKLQINMFAQQQKVFNLNIEDPAYKEEEIKLFTAKEALQRYIQTLQTAYPTYHQYKYADAVPGLSQLQNYLRANGQSFINYFISDTVIYVLAVTPSSSKFIKQSRNDFTGELSNFLKTCSNLLTLNNNYSHFAAQAHTLYQILFKPLALPKGKIIVCYDGVMIPFEALTTDKGGKDFLINGYSFSYVYSAQALLKKFNNPTGDGNFLGVAPVTYAAALSVSTLQGSGASLQKSSAYYSNNKLLTGRAANRYNLLSNLSRYSIVAVLSHARADSSDKEPVLFMTDSVIHLSELQLLRNPATELIVLSACQTNVGKLATGEGVFSLTRGFAAAGIPSITATLWKADEEAIYKITEIFLQNVANGMRKDDALQQAKLSFIQDGNNKSGLPYYWANMILAGNGEPVILAGTNNKKWWIGSIVLLTAIILATIVAIRKRKNHSLS